MTIKNSIWIITNKEKDNKTVFFSLLFSLSFFSLSEDWTKQKRKQHFREIEEIIEKWMNLLVRSFVVVVVWNVKKWIVKFNFSIVLIYIASSSKFLVLSFHLSELKILKSFCWWLFFFNHQNPSYQISAT